MLGLREGNGREVKKNKNKGERKMWARDRFFCFPFSYAIQTMEKT